VLNDCYDTAWDDGSCPMIAAESPESRRFGWPRFVTARTVGFALGFVVLGCAPLRMIDGTGNNENDPNMGAANTALLRLADAQYDWTADHPSAREISNLVCDQPETKLASASKTGGVSGGLDSSRASDMVWQWGQFLDHDIDITGGADPKESDPILVPAGDAWFDPMGTGEATIGFSRSAFMPGLKPHQQVNQITAWIDGSNIYGSDAERASALRTHDGTGRLATSEGNLLPFNHDGFPNAGGPGDELFLAGDVRANEQVGLTAMHTVWVREHNLWATKIKRRMPRATGDEIYEAARVAVGAELQIITYVEFLPILLGDEAIPAYSGYDPGLDARIANEFSTAAYRFGHSMLSPSLKRLDRYGRPTAEGPLPLRDAFFAPHRILEEGGIDPILRGLVHQPAQEVDPYLVDDVRNFLFGPPGAGGFDLASLNIQRGRDHGLPSYNDLREAMGFDRARGFEDITKDPELQDRLESAYGDVERVELWVGGLAEDPAPGALVGPLVRAILADQFTSLRDGDRYWYQRVLPASAARLAEKNTSLAKIIRRNTGVGREIPDDVFRVKSAQPPRHGPKKKGSQIEGQGTNPTSGRPFRH
jgi:peroxidase